ncbi:carboxylesterase BioH, putative [beta proteobacterium KB13]|uniref:Carboxylesterase BioH, putative n=1 Tax=beta proteobacterium KB13 TaxID=314607 RepID=B6BUV3_9PROT|nr:carboxylesterase BioH, putative [beta proteobacterium KB13]
MLIESLGAGHPIIFIHGWAMNKDVFKPFFEKLDKNKYQLLFFDLPEMDENDAWEKCINQINDEIQNYNFDSFDIFGWSLGGQVAIEIYRLNREKVKKIILASSTPIFVNNDLWKLGLNEVIFENFAKSIMNHQKKTLTNFFNLQLLGQESKKTILNYLIKCVASKDINFNSLKFYLSHMKNNNFLTFMGNMNCDIYLIAGVQDKIVPIQSQTFMHKNIRNVKKTIFINKASHVPFLSHPDECATYLNDIYS